MTKITDHIQRFYSRGKLLLSGEYLVLDGALALAVPAKWGQEMLVNEIHQPHIIQWKTFQQSELWFHGTYDTNDHIWRNQSNLAAASYLKQILVAVDIVNPDLFDTNTGFDIRCNLEFPFDWGLGSSSTLISNMAAWADADPFALNEKVSKGSGYDIATARSKRPILYRLTQLGRAMEEVAFYPIFKDQLLFVYLGAKQATEKSLVNYLNKQLSHSNQIEEISNISSSLVEEQTLEGFMRSIRRHEKIVAEVLDTETVQERLFPDFDGVIKSLGAWGGDFVLASSIKPISETVDYFLSRGFETILHYDEMVLGR